MSFPNQVKLAEEKGQNESTWTEDLDVSAWIEGQCESIWVKGEVNFAWTEG